MRQRQYLSPEGLDEIKRREGLVLTAYQDDAGVWTFGYGHTGKVFPGDVITQFRADQYLREDVRWAEATINANVKVPLNQNQFDALVSWTFNIGVGNTIESTLLRRLNGGDYGAVASELMRWVKVTDPATGKLVFNQGLQNRRLSEVEQFGTDVSGVPNIAPDAPTIIRGASIAAVPAGREELAPSRTLRGAAVAGGGGIASAVVQATSQAKWQLQDMAYYIPALKWALIAVIVIGAAAAIYARIDDHKKGLK